MKRKEEGPLIAVVFKALAVLGAIMSAWQFAKGLIGSSNSDPVIQATHSGAAWGAAITLFSSALALWWMGEVIDLLARIVRNTSLTSSGAKLPAPSTPARKASASTATPEDPPSYQL